MTGCLCKQNDDYNNSLLHNGDINYINIGNRGKEMLSKKKRLMKTP